MPASRRTHEKTAADHRPSRRAAQRLRRRNPGVRGQRRAREPGIGQHHRRHLDPGPAPDLRHPGGLQGRHHRPRARPGDLVELERGRHELDLQAAPRRQVPRRHPPERRRRGLQPVALVGQGAPLRLPQPGPHLRDRGRPAGRLQGRPHGRHQEHRQGERHDRARGPEQGQQRVPQRDRRRLLRHRLAHRHQEGRRQVRHPGQHPGRHRPLHLPELAHRRPRDPQGERGLLGRQAQGGHGHHPLDQGRLAAPERAQGRHHRLHQRPDPRQPAQRDGRQEPRGRQAPELQRGLPEPEQPQPVPEKRPGASGHQHGDQQEGHRERLLERPGHQQRQLPAPGARLGQQRQGAGRLQVRPRRRQEDAGRRRLPQRLFRGPVVHAGQPPVLPQPQAHRRGHRGRPLGHRREGQPQDRGLGQVPRRPQQDPRLRHVHDRLDRRLR